MEKKEEYKPYEKIWGGLSKEEVWKGCRNYARFVYITQEYVHYCLPGNSYRTLKKFYKSRARIMTQLSGGKETCKIPNIFWLCWRREWELLEEDCYKILEFADYSDEQVLDKARECIEEEKQSIGYIIWHNHRSNCENSPE